MPSTKLKMAVVALMPSASVEYHGESEGGAATKLAEREGEILAQGRQHDRDYYRRRARRQVMSAVPRLAANAGGGAPPTVG